MYKMYKFYNFEYFNKMPCECSNTGGTLVAVNLIKKNYLGHNCTQSSIYPYYIYMYYNLTNKNMFLHKKKSSFLSLLFLNFKIQIESHTHKKTLKIIPFYQHPI